MKFGLNGRWLISLVVILILLTLLAACGAPPATTSPTSTGTVAPTQAGPKYGGTLKLAWLANPNVLDPILALDQTGYAWAKLYYGSPLKWTGPNDSDIKLVPWFFKSYEVSPDGMVITSKLNEGIKYQNIPPVNGRELTAADWKFSLERILDTKNRSPLRPYLSTVDRIEAPDKYTVKMYLKEPDPAMPINMGSGSQAFISREVIEKDGNANKTVIGPGPFIFKEFVPNNRGVFEKNPDYWEKGKPYVDRVEIYIITESAARLAAIRAGQLDYCILPKADADALRASNPEIKIVDRVQVSGNALYMSIKENPKTFGDPRVRKAVLLALDYDGIITAAYDGAAYRTDWLGPQLKEWGVRDVGQLPKRDVAKAKALMAEAGFASGFKTNLISNFEASSHRAAEPIAAMLKDIGIDAEIKSMDKATFQALNKTGEFGLCLGGCQIFRPEPDLCLQPLYTSKGVMNYSWYNNARMDELYTLQHMASGNPAQRKTYIQEMFSILDNDVPFAPICIPYNYAVMQPWVKGWTSLGDGNNEYAYYFLSNVWLDK